MGSMSSSVGTEGGEVSVISRSFASANSASASSPGIAQYSDISSRLDALQMDAVEFTEVQIIRQPVRTGVAEHHLLVYWYTTDTADGIADRGLQIDWGQNGLSFNDCIDMPQGSIVINKSCGILPATLLNHIRKIERRVYNLVMWNCRHFCGYLFDRTGGNAKLGHFLLEMQEQNGFICSAGIHRSLKGEVEDGADIWTSIYWCQDPAKNELSVLQLEWGATGLTFHDLKSYGVQNIVRVRECNMPPLSIVWHLREVEGWCYNAETWNDKQFSQRMFDSVPAKGGYLQLLAHLEEMGQRGIEIAGVLDVLSSNAAYTGDHHVLVYKYKMPDHLTLHLLLDFGEKGVVFRESEDEPAGTLLVRSKPMLFVRLQPKELHRQLREVEDRPYDSADWNSQHFCDHLFSQAPGRERQVLRAIQEVPRKKMPSAAASNNGALSARKSMK